MEAIATRVLNDTVPVSDFLAGMHKRVAGVAGGGFPRSPYVHVYWQSGSFGPLWPIVNFVAIRNYS